MYFYGDIINSQYEDGRLVETVRMEYGNTHSIFSTSYREERSLPEEVEIDISGWKIEKLYPEASLHLSREDTLGKIRFSTLTGLQTVEVSYERTGEDLNTAVQIPSATYSLVQLGSILSMIMGIPGFVGSAIASAIFWAIGALSLGGSYLIAGEFSVLGDEYTYYLDNLTTGDFSDTLVAYHYTVVEEVKGDGKYQGDIVWNGYNPDEAWGDIGFAEEVFIHIIGGTTWSVGASI